MALEELSEFFELGEHGTAATYTPSGGTGSSIVVVFRNEFYLEDLGNVGVETSQPIVTVETSKVPGVANGDVITIESANYNVVGVRPDGTGISEIVLEAQ
jgi:pectate lyase